MANAAIVLTATDKTQAAFSSAQRNFEKLQASANSFSAALAPIGISLSAGAFAAFVKSSIDAADNLNDLSKKTGIAVENLVGLQLVVDKSGTTMEMLGGGVAKLNKTLGEAAAGSKSAQTVLRDLGITATDPMEAFYQLADAFGRFKTEGDKANAMSQVIGKTWTELAPALAEGGDGLRAIVEEGKRLNPVTKEMAEQADKFNDAMSRFKTQASGVATAIATSLLPAMNDMLTRWNDAISLSSRHGGFVGLVLGGINPTGTNSANLKAVRDEIAAIQLQLKDAGTVQGDIAGINGPRLRARLSELEAIKQTLLEIQGREALALNDQFGTGNYKQPSPPGRSKISLTPDGKTAKPKDRMSDTEWAMEESAHLTRTLYQIGEEMDQARAAAFDRAEEAAKDWTDSLDAANAKLRDAAAGYIDLIDPVEKYRRKLDEIAQLQEAGLLTKEQATEATFAIQEQIDGLDMLGKKLTETADDFQKTLQKNFQNGLADFLFDPFKDGVDGMLDSFRVMLQRMVAESIAADITRSIFGNFGSGGQNIFGSIAELFGFEQGGIMTGAGPLALQRYAAGGVANSPQLALFGEGRQPEAYVPLPDGRRIPVAMQGGGSGQGGITIHVTIQATDLGSFQRSEGQISATLARAVASARRYQ